MRIGLDGTEPSRAHPTSRGTGPGVRAGGRGGANRALGSSMDAREFIKVGMSAERTLVVPPERTVRHFVPSMPPVYATPMMIMEMEMTSADAINPYLEQGWVTVGTEVDIRDLAATAIGAMVGAPARGGGPRRGGRRSSGGLSATRLGPATTGAASARAAMPAPSSMSRASPAVC